MSERDELIRRLEEIPQTWHSDREMYALARDAAAYLRAQPTPREGERHVTRALALVSRSLESREAMLDVCRQTGGTAPEIVQGLLDDIRALWDRVPVGSALMQVGGGHPEEHQPVESEAREAVACPSCCCGIHSLATVVSMCCPVHGLIRPQRPQEVDMKPLDWEIGQ